MFFALKKAPRHTVRGAFTHLHLQGLERLKNSGAAGTGFYGGQMAVGLQAVHGLHVPCHGKDLFEVDARFHTHLLGHEDYIFHGDVARGTRCEGASAQAAGCSVKGGNPRIQRGEHIGQGHSVGGMKVKGQRIITEPLPQGRQGIHKVKKGV